MAILGGLDQPERDMGRFLKFLLGLALLVYLAPVLAGAVLVAWVAIAEAFGHIGP